MVNYRLASILTIVSGVAQKSVPFLASFLVAKNFGTDQFASFSFALNTANVITAVCALGLSPAILTTVAESRKRDSALTHQVTKQMMGVASIIAILSSIVAALILFLGAETSKVSLSNSVIILAPSLVLFLATHSAYQANLNYIAPILQSMGLFILVIGMVLFVSKAQLDISIINTYSYAYFAVGLAAMMLLLFNTLRRKGAKFKKAPTRFVSILMAQLPFAGYTAVWMLSIYLCNYFVAKNYSSSDLAVYNASYQWYSILILIPSLLGGVWIPKFASSSNQHTAYKQIIKLTYLYVVVLLPIITLTFFFIPELLSFYSLTSTQISVNTARLIVGSGGLAALLTPTLQLYLAQRKFLALYCVSALWAIVALVGVFFFADSVVDVAASFFWAYVLIAIFCNADLVRLKLKNNLC